MEETRELIILIREYRDRELRATDWVAGVDIPKAIQDVYFPYRQELRDLPNQPDLESVVAPERPTLGDT